MVIEAAKLKLRNVFRGGNLKPATSIFVLAAALTAMVACNRTTATAGKADGAMASESAGAQGKVDSNTPGHDLTGVWRRSRRAPDNKRKYHRFRAGAGVYNG